MARAVAAMQIVGNPIPLHRFDHLPGRRARFLIEIFVDHRDTAVGLHHLLQQGQHPLPLRPMKGAPKRDQSGGAVRRIQVFRLADLKIDGKASRLRRCPPGLQHRPVRVDRQHLGTGPGERQRQQAWPTADIDDLRSRPDPEPRDQHVDQIRRIGHPMLDVVVNRIGEQGGGVRHAAPRHPNIDRSSSYDFPTQTARSR